jgi:hypothetical protein
MQHHQKNPFPRPRNHLVMRSWLKATRINGIDIAAEIVTIKRSRGSKSMQYFEDGMDGESTYACISGRNSSEASHCRSPGKSQ